MMIKKLRLKRREKVTVLAGGLLALAIISFHLFTLYGDFRASVRERIEAKEIYHQRQMMKISEKVTIEKRLASSEDELKKLKGGLLSGDKPPVAAAELQKLLKDMASSLALDIKSERALSPLDMGNYLGIPVEIGFSTSTAKLKDLLVKIETSPFLLTVSQIDVSVRNVKNSGEVYAALTVRGFIEKEVEQ